jgi:hypothetical protein
VRLEVSLDIIHSIKMALPARPDIVNLNGQTTYRSLDADDQSHFDDLNTDLHRRKFVEMIHRLRARNGMTSRPLDYTSLTCSSPGFERRSSYRE